MSTNAIVRTFLPDADTTTGPFGLLGLPPRPADNTAIETALERRLQQINQHPQHASADAHDLRGSLHIAAAQLKDTDLQHAILNELERRDEHQPTAPEPRTIAARQTPEPVEAPPQHPPPQTSPPQPPQQPTATATPSTDDAHTFHDAARHALARSGGWNARGKRMLASLAAGEGVDAAALRTVLVDINRAESRRSTDPTPPHPRTPQPPGPHAINTHPNQARRRPTPHPAHPVDAPPTSKPLRRWMNIATAALFALSAAIIAALALVLLARATTTAPPTPESTVSIDLNQRDTPTTPAQPNQPTNAPPPASERITATDVAALKAANPPERFASADAQTLYDALRNLTPRTIAADPADALGVFRGVLQRFADAWPNLPATAVAGVTVPVRDAVLAARKAEPALGTRFAEEIPRLAEPLRSALDNRGTLRPDDIRRAAFARALAAELSSELPAPERDALTDTATTAADAGIWPRITAALRDTAAKLIERIPRRPSTPDPWPALADAMRAAADAAPTRGLAAILDTLQQTLRATAHPDADPRTNRSAAAAIANLARVTPWNDTTTAAPRTRLIAFFDDQSIPTPALANLLDRLISNTLLEGLTHAERLAADADPPERNTARERVALALGIDTGNDADAFNRAWRAEASQLINTPPPSSAPAAIATHAAALAALNEAAALAASASAAPAADALDRAAALRARAAFAADPDPPKYDPLLPRQPVAGASADAIWAVRMINARNDREQRATLLNQLRNAGSPVGRVDAAVLAETAMYSSPRSIRALAQQVASELAAPPTNDPAVLAALLETLADAAATPGVLAMLQNATARTLPTTDDEQWRTAARAALAVRLAEVTANAGHPALNDAADAIAASYTARAAARKPRDYTAPNQTEPPPISPDSPGPLAETKPDPPAAADDLANAWLAAAARFAQPAGTTLSLPAIERRRHARQQLARGPLQTFLAHQSAVAETIAWLATVRTPASQQAIDAILADLARDTRTAATAIHQIAATENAIARLWQRRIEDDAP